MQSNRAVAKKMLSYAKKNNLKYLNDKGKPILSTRSPFWGSGKRTLAWRVSGHAFGPKKASAQKTQRLCDLLFPMTFGQWVVRLAKAEVGVRESPAGSNDGPRIRVYQKTTGALRAPWCASFIRYIYGAALNKVSKNTRWFANPAWVPNWTSAARANKRFHKVAFEDARPGDFVTLWDSGHIEIIVKRKGNYLLCIGGNTSPVGRDANGGMVANTKRHRSEVTAIGRMR